MSFFLSDDFYLFFTYLLIHLFNFYLSFYLSIHLFIYLFIFYSFTYLFIYLFMYFFIFFFSAMNLQSVTLRIEEKKQRKQNRLKLKDLETQRKFWLRIVFIVNIHIEILSKLPRQISDMNKNRRKIAAETLIKFQIMKYHARLKAGEFMRFKKIMNGPGFERISKLFLIMVILIFLSSTILSFILLFLF